MCYLKFKITLHNLLNTQNIEFFEPNHLKLRPIVGGPKCPTRKLSQLIDILEKPLKHIKTFIRDSFDSFLIKSGAVVRRCSVKGLRPAALLKKRLLHRCFPVNFAKYLRTPFLQNTFGRLLLLNV